MSVARACARKRRQMRQDIRYKGKRIAVAKGLQGRTKLLAQQAITRRDLTN